MTFACPLCTAVLQGTEGDDAWRCARCDVDFERWGSLACLMPDPEAHRDDCAEALHEHLARVDGALGALDRQLDDQLREEARARVRHVRDTTAANRKALVHLLGSAGISPQPPMDGPLTRIMVSATEILRDWGWDEGEHEENATALRITTQALAEAEASPARILVLGAGAGRLAFDLHRALEATCTVALDVHPLPLLVASQLVAGASLPWHEFPPAPRAGTALGVKVELPGREEASEGLSFLLADGLSPPVKPGSFDLVVTPWFLNQVPRNRPALLRALHGCLAPGGHWLHHGPLLYPSWVPTRDRHTAPEIEALAEDAGLTVGPRRVDRLPYLCSPHAAQGRLEDVITWVARRDDAPAHPSPPSWLVDTRVPVPRLPDDGVRFPSHPVTAFVQAAVDGRTSIDAMAARIGESLRMGTSTAHGSVREVVEAWTNAVRG